MNKDLKWSHNSITCLSHISSIISVYVFYEIKLNKYQPSNKFKNLSPIGKRFVTYIKTKAKKSNRHKIDEHFVWKLCSKLFFSLIDDVLSKCGLANYSDTYAIDVLKQFTHSPFETVNIALTLIRSHIDAWKDSKFRMIRESMLLDSYLIPDSYIDQLNNYEIEAICLSLGLIEFPKHKNIKKIDEIQSEMFFNNIPSVFDTQLSSSFQLNPLSTPKSFLSPNHNPKSFLSPNHNPNDESPLSNQELENKDPSLNHKLNDSKNKSKDNSEDKSKDKLNDNSEDKLNNPKDKVNDNSKDKSKDNLSIESLPSLNANSKKVSNTKAKLSLKYNPGKKSKRDLKQKLNIEAKTSLNNNLDGKFRDYKIFRPYIRLVIALLINTKVEFAEISLQKKNLKKWSKCSDINQFKSKLNLQLIKTIILLGEYVEL